MYMKASRTGGLADLAPAAQLSESMKGNARERPAPFSQARRSTRERWFMAVMLWYGCVKFLLTNIIPKSYDT